MSRRPMIELFAYDNPVLRNYAFWCAILVLKMLLMTLLTAAQRIRTKVSQCNQTSQTITKRIFIVLLSKFVPALSLSVGVLKQLQKTFANTEDLKMNRLKEVKFDDPHVERARRAHRNDLESIVPYLLIAFVYVLTDPTPAVACNLFRVVCGCRIFHTIVYAVYVLPQPTRAISFFVPFGITCYMAVQSAVVFVN